MNYKIVIASKHEAKEVLQLDYKQNAKDFAVREANTQPHGTQVDVVNTATGLSVGRAYRPHPGTAVIWQDLR